MRAALAMAAAVLACTVYANLSFIVTDPADYRFFPPFRPFFNANGNRELGGETYQIAKSMVAGAGFANPFKEPTGPTAWAPPVLPSLLAGLLWTFDGDRTAVMGVIFVLQASVLIGTGLLVLALARQTTCCIRPWLVACFFVAALVLDFRIWFQHPTDSWLVLLDLDLLIAGWAWWRPLANRKTALGWGLFGGISALISPIAGFAWAMLTLSAGCRQRAWSRLSVTALAALLAVAPWTIRNYLVFGRWIPVKSNLAYELYQSQCLQPDGLLQRNTFMSHPHVTAGRHRQEYKELGEVGFLDQKRRQFGQAVLADPPDFLKRVLDRFFGATLWYVPLDREDLRVRPGQVWLCRIVHPVPFLALLVLLALPRTERLSAALGAAAAVYCFYLLPYIAISYYERYAMPLVAVKALLVLWAVDRVLSLKSATT